VSLSSLSWSDTLDDVDWHELEALYRAAPLGNKSAALLETVFTNSRFRCFVRDDGRLVGAGRVLADGADCAYLCDLAVLPSHQGTGLGKALVNELVRCAHGHKKIILYAVPGKEAFYKKLGFARMTTAMAIFEDQPAAFKRGYLDAD
jgi:GNAT superfamily N-acetyltransferase